MAKTDSYTIRLSKNEKEELEKKADEIIEESKIVIFKRLFFDESNLFFYALKTAHINASDRVSNFSTYG